MEPDHTTKSTVSTTTQIALHPPPHKKRVVAPPLSDRRDTDLVQQNMDMSRQLIAVLTKQVRTLEQQIDTLQETCRAAAQCNILVYGSHNDLSVAAVTDTSEEGVALFARVSDMFQQNQMKLHKRGIAFGIIQDVPVNRIHETPFSAPTS